jgi:predicted amidohydrolase YtcJ
MANHAGPADVVLVGGPVMTMDPARPSAQAVAVRDGRLVAGGDSRDVLELEGARTRRIDLRGRTLLPGFIDAHCHPVHAGIHLSRCPLHDLPNSREAYFTAIREYADAHPELDWIVGSGWYMSVFPGGTPSRHELDAVVPDRPAIFINRDGHGAWVNTRALEIAGITSTTPDPADGRIERDADGTPSGTLHEGAMALVGRNMPAPSIDEIADGIGIAQAYLHRLGITAWQDAIVTPPELEAYRLFAESGRLTARVIGCQWWWRELGDEQIESFIDERARSTIGRLEAGTVKIMADGVCENFTASVLEPYLDDEGRSTRNMGIDFIDPERLKSHVTKLDALGFQVHFHALGDRAVRQALDAVEAARRTNGMTDTRPHLAHLQLVDPADWPRFRELGAGANIQPLWACADEQMRELTLPYLSPDRAALSYPIGSMHRAGARLIGGSDWMVSTPNVFEEIEVAVTRVSPQHRDIPPFLPDEAIDLETALRAFTMGSAWACHRDTTTGSIEVGKLADLVVMDRDIAQEPANRLGDARVLLTLVEGEVVHEDPALDGS